MLACVHTYMQWMQYLCICMHARMLGYMFGCMQIGALRAIIWKQQLELQQLHLSSTVAADGAAASRSFFHRLQQQQQVRRQQLQQQQQLQEQRRTREAAAGGLDEELKLVDEFK